MKMQTVNNHDVEQDRQEQVQQLLLDSGADCLDEYKPGSAGCHELLDRTAMLADMLERYVVAHPACIARSEWYLLADQAAAALRELYQQVGAQHLSAEDAD